MGQSNTEQHQPYHSDDEIDLAELFLILWKRKILIILGTVVCALAGIGISIFMTEVYEIDALIEPGKRIVENEEVPVASPIAIKEKVLAGVFDQNIQKELKISAREYPNIYVDLPKDTNLVKFRIESSDIQRAKDILNAILLRITRDTEEKIKKTKDEIENKIKLAKIVYQGKVNQVKLLAEQVKETKATIEDFKMERKKAMSSRSTDAMAVLLYSNEIQNKQIYLNDLNRKLSDMETQSQASKIELEQLKLDLSNIIATQIDKSPTASSDPIKPKKILIVALSFLLGLMGTIMLAFILEYVQAARQRKEDGSQGMHYRTD
ncbi:Wzz/FepE/Etk N-terminal domain-containing protein [Candidatus Electrothrix sp.]|uniref:Wzz/FepE/Etk N-terminal domain-containing protein n=2 Tax=Candidatus Electrothrix sp. TaxID=2170559 RepID=UPI0040560F9D